VLTTVLSLAIMGSHNVACRPTQANTPRPTRFTYPGGMEG